VKFSLQVFMQYPERVVEVTNILLMGWCASAPSGVSCGRERERVEEWPADERRPYKRPTNKL
jgi:hypothetical protein